MDGNGNYVVAWTTDNGGTSRGVRLTLFDAAGTALSGEIQVNTFTANDQRYPSVAMEPGGNFVVVWSSDGQDGAGTGIYAQRYDSAGAPQGAEFQINNTTAGNQDRPQVAMDGSGNFVVAWTSDQGGDLDIYARRYAANGSALGNEFLVNSVDVANDQDQPAIAMDSAGNFVVAWRTSSTLDGSSTGVFAQRYDSAGSTVGAAFQVNTTGAGAQLEPSVAMNDGGAFVISWTSVNQDGSSNGVYAQRYNAAGVAQGGEFLVNTTTADAQDNSSVAIDASGNFTIVWSSNNQDGSSRGIYGQAYGFNGTPVGSEFRINTTTSNAQNLPVIAMRASTGDFVVAWEGESASDADGIAAQRYQSINVAPVTTVPGAQSTNEDTAKVFSSANGNQISITDVDAGGANNEVTLSVTNGTLTLAGITGLTLTSGDGTADAAMTLRGTASAINTALDGLSYSPTANYNGSATLTLATTDSVLLSLDIDTGLLGRYAFENTGALGTDTSPAAGYAGTVSGAAAVNDGTRGNVLNLAGAG